MYVGIREIDYNETSHCVLENMQWPSQNKSNYGSKVDKLIECGIDLNRGEFAALSNLISFILENVHDHGTGKCKIIIGKTDDSAVVEIFEESGGFDLAELPHGIGGWGFKTIQRSQWEVSHSNDGRRTFIVLKLERDGAVRYMEPNQNGTPQ